MSVIDSAIDAAAACVLCGKIKRDGCDCWVSCGCAWRRERGEKCRRCGAVEVRRIGPSRYEARPGASLVTTRKDGRHWRFTVECGCGCRFPSHEDDRLFGTNRDAMAAGIARAFLMLDDPGPPARGGKA